MTLGALGHALGPRREYHGLAVVGVVHLGAQLVLAPWRLAPSWDESIYLSQVVQGPSLPFAASRARGVTILVAPWVTSGVPLTTLRIVLAVATAAAITLAFVPWVRLLGAGAVWAAGLFASGWVALFYASAVMPNLWVALLGVATVGVAIRALEHPDRRSLIVAGALASAAAAFRPFDAIAIVTPILAVVGVRRAWSVAGALSIGTAAGLAPWIVEMCVRFGGPAAALEAARDVGRVGGAEPIETVRAYLALADGPLLGASGPVSAIALLWLAVVVIAATVGLALATREVRPFLALAVASAVLPGALYVVFVLGTAPRFLLPTFALLSLPAGAGLAAAAGRPVVLAGVIVIAALWVGSHLAVALDVTRTADVERAAPQATGLELGRLVGPDDCVVIGRSWPQVAYAAGCAGVQDTVDPVIAAREAAAVGDRPFVVTRPGVPPPDAQASQLLFSANGLDVYEVVPNLAGDVAP